MIQELSLRYQPLSSPPPAYSLSVLRSDRSLHVAVRFIVRANVSNRIVKSGVGPIQSARHHCRVLALRRWLTSESWGLGSNDNINETSNLVRAVDVCLIFRGLGPRAAVQYPGFPEPPAQAGHLATPPLIAFSLQRAL